MAEKEGNDEDDDAPTDKASKKEAAKRKAEEEAKRAQAFKEYEEYEGQLCKEMDKLSKKMKSKAPQLVEVVALGLG